MGTCMHTEQRPTRNLQNRTPTLVVPRRYYLQQKNTFDQLRTTQAHTPGTRNNYTQYYRNSASSNDLSSTPQKDAKCFVQETRGQIVKRGSKQVKGEERCNWSQKEYKISEGRTTRSGSSGYQQQFPVEMKNSKGQKCGQTQSIDPHQQNFYRQQQIQTTVFQKKRINSTPSCSTYVPNNKVTNQKKVAKVENQVVAPLNTPVKVVRVSRKKSRQMLELMSEQSELEAKAFDQEGDSRIYVKGMASNISFLVPRDRAGPLVVSQIDYEIYAI